MLTVRASSEVDVRHRAFHPRGQADGAAISTAVPLSSSLAGGEETTLGPFDGGEMAVGGFDPGETDTSVRLEARCADGTVMETRELVAAAGRSAFVSADLPAGATWHVVTAGGPLLPLALAAPPTRHYNAKSPAR